MSDPKFTIPWDQSRVAIIGRTGSGKTQFATWMLSERSIDKKPWIVFNFKGDKLIDAIRETKELALDATVPKAPGIYIMRPQPHQTEEVNDFLWKVWERENVGLYIDEGYMMTGLKAFRSCLTQGRSKNIPMMILSQRPVWMDKFTWSEADYYAIFNLNILSDKQIVREYVPRAKFPLPKFNAIWHDVAEDETFLLRPVPDRATILSRFRDRIGIKRRTI
jgi:hypothetical protein